MKEKIQTKPNRAKPKPNRIGALASLNKFDKLIRNCQPTLTANSENTLSFPRDIYFAARIIRSAHIKVPDSK